MGAHRTVLIVEDDRVFRDALVGLLEDEQFEVMTSDSLQRARYILFQSRHPVGVVLLDLALPDGSAESLLDELARHPHSPPIVVISAVAARAEPAANAYGVPVVMKPAEASMIVASVLAAFEHNLRPRGPMLPDSRTRSGTRRRVLD